MRKCFRCIPCCITGISYYTIKKIIKCRRWGNISIIIFQRQKNIQCVTTFKGIEIKDFGTALAQIERTIDRIGKLPTRLRLCRAAVVLSNGNRVPSYAKQVEQLRRRGILVTAKSQRLEMSV